MQNPSGQNLISGSSPCCHIWHSPSPRQGEHADLVAEVDIGVSGEQQWHHVHVAVLGGEVHGGDALPGDGVGVRAVLQQRGGDVHLVLLGSYVQGCVTILPTENTLFNKVINHFSVATQLRE